MMNTRITGILPFALVLVISLGSEAFAREYDPRTGRFLQIDPILDLRVGEHYGYAGNRPTWATDLDGSRFRPHGTPENLKSFLAAMRKATGTEVTINKASGFMNLGDPLPGRVARQTRLAGLIKDAMAKKPTVNIDIVRDDAGVNLEAYLSRKFDVGDLENMTTALGGGGPAWAVKPHEHVLHFLVEQWQGESEPSRLGPSAAGNKNLENSKRFFQNREGQWVDMKVEYRKAHGKAIAAEREYFGATNRPGYREAIFLGSGNGKALSAAVRGKKDIFAIAFDVGGGSFRYQIYQVNGTPFSKVSFVSITSSETKPFRALEDSKAKVVIIK